MEKVYILETDGTPVKLNDSQFTEIATSVDGFLTSFKVGEIVYRFYNSSYFNEHDRKGLRNDYLDEQKYLQYIQFKDGESPTLEQLFSKHSFNFEKYLASVNDSASVDLLNFDAPFDFYYKKHIATFDISADLDGNGVSKYMDLEKGLLQLPPDAIITASEKNLNNLPTGYFYAKNFGNVAGLWTITELEKQSFSRITTLIAFVISQITSEIFPKLLSSTEMAVVDGMANAPDVDISNLPTLEKIIFTIKKSWGQYYDPLASPDLPHRTSFEPVFSLLPEYAQYDNYFISLKSFYNTAYKIQDKLLNRPEEERLRFLIEILSFNALSVIPFKYRIDLLKDIMKGSISESLEGTVLKIVFSILPGEENAFLDFLLLKNDGVTTNFEALYIKMDDQRLERYPIVSLFVTEEPNRMYFIKAVYNLWQTSKYSFHHSDGTINPDSFFLTDGLHYNYENGDLKARVLEFGVIDKVQYPDGNPGLVLVETTSVDYNVDKEMEGILVVINKQVDFRFSFINQDGNTVGTASGKNRNEKIPTKYHVYYPITIYGHKETETDIIPHQQPVPAFLFYYTRDFERLKKIDAAYALGIEVGIEIILFFTLAGGTTLLKGLTHLKHITKINRAIFGSLPAEETVLVWRGVESASEVLALKASLFTSLSTYNATILPPGPERNRQIEISKTFLWITLAFGGGSILFRYKAVNAADRIIDGINALPPGIPHGIPQDVIDVLTVLKGEKIILSTIFRDKLNSLFDVGVTNRIISKYDNFSEEIKNGFWKDFERFPPSHPFWSQLNASDDYIDNWKNLYARKIIDRGRIDFLVNQSRVNGVIRFYDELLLRPILENFSYEKRMLFIDDFADLDIETFSNLSIKPEGVEMLVYGKRPSRTGDDVYTLDDVKFILNSELENDFVGILHRRNLLTKEDVLIRFNEKFTMVDMTTLKLSELHEKFTEYFTFPQDVIEYQKANKMHINTKVYNDNIQVAETIEYFISGSVQKLQTVFGPSTLISSNFVEPLNYTRFENFNIKAFCGEPRPRMYATEMKFIFTFMENNWVLGNKFTIEMESVLYSCESCQRYLIALHEYSLSQGKILNLRFVADPQAKGMSQVKNILN